MFRSYDPERSVVDAAQIKRIDGDSAWVVVTDGLKILMHTKDDSTHFSTEEGQPPISEADIAERLSVLDSTWSNACMVRATFSVPSSLVVMLKNHDQVALNELFVRIGGVINRVSF